MPGSTVELDHEQSLPLTGAYGIWIKVIYGCVWISGTGETNDWLVESEEAVVRVPRGSVIRSIGRTRIEVIEGQRMGRLRHFPQKVRRWLRLPGCARASGHDGA